MGLLHKEGIRKTMSDSMETCQSARAQAIMSGTTAELVIHPRMERVKSRASRGEGYGGWAQSAKFEWHEKFRR